VLESRPVRGTRRHREDTRRREPRFTDRLEGCSALLFPELALSGGLRLDQDVPVNRFERVAGIAAIAVAFGALLYAAIFADIVYGHPPLWLVELWFGLLIGGGITTIVVMAGVYERLRAADPGMAVVALLLGTLGGLGGVLHGAFGLAALLGRSVGSAQLDPMGILRYATAGLALLAVGWIVRQTGVFPRALGALAMFGGFLLVLIYVGRLYDFITPNVKASLIPPILYGFIVHPVLYVGLGRSLLRGDPSSA